MTTWDWALVALLVTLLLPFYTYLISKSIVAGRYAAMSAFLRHWKHPTEEATDGEEEKR